MSIATGDTVRIHYTGRLESGKEFDSSREREPLEFTAGGEELIPGVSFAVIGMEVGESKTVDVPPELGYGPKRDELLVRVHRSQLPEEVEVGMVLGLNTPEGQVHAVLTELGDDKAVLDGNHPLAGKTLVFEIEIVGMGAG